MLLGIGTECGESQKQPPEVFFKKSVLKNFSIFTGKHLCCSLFLIKMQAWSRNFKEHLLSRASANGFWKVYYKNIRTMFWFISFWHFQHSHTIIDHSFGTHVKFSQKLTFLTLWSAHVRLRIRGLEILVFRKIFYMY